MKCLISLYLYIYRYFTKYTIGIPGILEYHSISYFIILYYDSNTLFTIYCSSFTETISLSNLLYVSKNVALLIKIEECSL
jgi:hypothetical protein